MEMIKILDEIAHAFTEDDGAGWWPYLGGRPELHRVSDLVLTGSMGFARPDPRELTPIQIPPGRYPVYLQVVVDAETEKREAYGLPGSWVRLVVVPLGDPHEIAEALSAQRLEALIEDFQPLGPVGAIWGGDAQDLAWSSEFATRAAEELAQGAAAGHVPNVLEVPPPGADRADGGAVCIAFHTESAAGSGVATALLNPDGAPVCLVLNSTD